MTRPYWYRKRFGAGAHERLLFAKTLVTATFARRLRVKSWDCLLPGIEAMEVW